MTMPIEDVTVKCPECHKTYDDWYRGSVNLDLDDFDEEYIDKCSSAVCPHCGHKVYFNTLVVKKGVFQLKGEGVDEESDEEMDDEISNIDLLLELDCGDL